MILKSTNASYKRLQFNKLKIATWELLLFLMIVFPRNVQSLKLIVVIFMIMLVVIDIISQKRILLNKNIAIFMVLFLSYSISTSIIGLLNFNPGAIGFFRVNVIYYIILSILIIFVNNKESFQRISRVIIIASLVVSIYSILLLFVDLGIWSRSLFIDFDVTSNVGIHQGYTHLTNTNLSMMIFMAPFTTILFIEKYSDKYTPRLLIVISEFLLIIAILISGRRILWISLMIPVVLTFLTKKIIKRKFISSKSSMLKSFMVLLLSISLVTAIIQMLEKLSIISIEGIYIRFINAFTGAEGSIRMGQADALWIGFLESPIFGSGAGAGVSDLARNANNWLYELSYNLVLFNSGVIGFSIFTISFGFILLKLFRKINKEMNPIISIAICSGYISALIGNATNPYFSSSFDFLWFVFIPLMYISIADETDVNSDKATQPFCFE